MSTLPGQSKKKPVVDASSAILLFKANLFDALCSAYEVQMAQSVFDEVTANNHPGSGYFAQAANTGKIHIQRSLSSIGDGGQPTFLPVEDVRMDDGERDCLRLFAFGLGDFVIIDDRRGAVFCRDYGIPYINALLVPRVFLLAGRISPSAAASATETLIAIGRYSSVILNKAEKITDCRLSAFLP